MKLTWFGHSAFRLDAGDSVVLIDPFLTGNPVFEETGTSVEKAAEGCTHVAITHGHDDHVGDAVKIIKDNDATLIAIFDICMFLNGKGVEKFEPMNIGGTVKSGDIVFSLVNAVHSACTFDGSTPVYMGNPGGMIIRANGKSVYHMGDTDIFSDMALINDIHKPDTGLVPIGDRFTMSAKTAARACKSYFNFETIVPIHYGTFPIIAPNADEFVAEMAGQNVVVPKVNEAFNL